MYHKELFYTANSNNSINQKSRITRQSSNIHKNENWPVETIVLPKTRFCLRRFLSKTKKSEDKKSKNGKFAYFEWLFEILQELNEQKQPTETMRTSIVKILYKKGDRRMIGN